LIAIKYQSLSKDPDKAKSLKSRKKKRPISNWGKP